MITESKTNGTIQLVGWFAFIMNYSCLSIALFLAMRYESIIFEGC